MASYISWTQKNWSLILKILKSQCGRMRFLIQKRRRCLLAFSPTLLLSWSSDCGPGTHCKAMMRNAEIIVIRFSEDDPNYPQMVRNFRRNAEQLKPGNVPFCLTCLQEFGVEDPPPHALVSAVPPSSDDALMPRVRCVCHEDRHGTSHG